VRLIGGKIVPLIYIVLPLRGRTPAFSSIARLVLPLRVRTRRSSGILSGLRPLRLTKKKMLRIPFLAQGGVPLNADVRLEL